MRELRRTGFGSFDIADAAPLDTWDRAGRTGLITLRQAIAHLPAVSLDDRVAEAVRQGKTWVLRTIDPDLGEAAALIDQRNEVVAIVVSRQHQWTYGRVLAE